MPGRIFVESKLIAGRQRHLYLVFQDTSGREFVIRGGQKDESQQGIIDGFLGNYGPILTEAGVSMTSSRDYRNPNDFPSNRSRMDITDKLNGRDPEAVWGSWTAFAKNIGYDQVEYELTGPNSNSTIAAILASEGIDINQVRPGEFENYPGVEDEYIRELLPPNIMPGTFPVSDPNAPLPWLEPSSDASEPDSDSWFSSIGDMFSIVGDAEAALPPVGMELKGEQLPWLQPSIS